MRERVNRKHRNKTNSKRRLDFDEENRRSKDFKRRKRNIKEQDYEQEDQYSRYKY